MTHELPFRDLPVPVGRRHFEDYVPDTVCVYGEIRFEEADIVEFARRYDPQPIHVDAAAAAAGPYGGVIASGWHTIGLVMKMLVERYLSHVAALVSPGVDELRWRQPVRPGDVLKVRITVLDARRSLSKPDRGLVRSRIEAINQRDEIVLSLDAMNFIRCRDAAGTWRAAARPSFTCRAAGSAPRRLRPNSAGLRNTQARHSSARATSGPCL